jgi:hypothetical protein
MKYSFNADEASVGDEVVVISSHGCIEKLDKIKAISPKRKDVTLMNTDIRFNKFGHKTDIWDSGKIAFVTDEIRQEIKRLNAVSEARRKLENVKCFLTNNDTEEVAQAILKGCECVKQELDKLFNRTNVQR